MSNQASEPTEGPVSAAGTICKAVRLKSTDRAHRRMRAAMTTNPARDLLVTGLRNAHGMEVQARELMERQCERLDDYPAVQARVRKHLAETVQQLHRLEKCLDA